MEIFNIGIPELIFICIIALVVLGPENLTKTAQQLGRWISKFTKSPIWHDVLSTSRELRDLPTKIVREAGLEESLSGLQMESNRISGELSSQFNQAMTDVQENMADTREELITAVSIPYHPMLPPKIGNPGDTDDSTPAASLPISNEPISNDPTPEPMGINPVMGNSDPGHHMDPQSIFTPVIKNTDGKLEIIFPTGPKV
jgi:Sec-independent protein translocase protein TatA